MAGQFGQLQNGFGQEVVSRASSYTRKKIAKCHRTIQADVTALQAIGVLDMTL